MQKAPALLVLMAALAAGSASAAGTLAGTTITNTASAEFPDPNNPTDPTKNISSPSNTVSTVVLPKPAFDVTYSDGTTDGGTQNDLSTTTVVTSGAVPGQQIATNYSLVNNGNVTLGIILNADTTGSASGEVVKYYRLNTDGSRGAEIVAGSTVTVLADDPATPGTDEGVIKIVQVVTLPTDPTLITPASVFGASPVGTVTGTQGADPLVTPGNGYANGSTVTEDGKAAATDRQFVRVTVFTPVLDNNPNTSVTNPVDSQGNPITNPALIPPVTSVDVPTETTGKANDNTPVVTTAGYVTPGAPASDPTPGGTPIVPNVATDEQFAYPKADTNATPDTVVFTNTLKNTGAASDTVQLYPVLANGTADPAYTYDDTTGVFTNTTTGVKVSFLDPVTGAVIKKSTDPTNPTAALYPTVTVPANSTGVYRVQVIFPDLNDSDPISQVSVQIGADSLKDADVVSNAATRDTILPPASQFGDATVAQGADSAPTPVQIVNPNGATGGSTSPDGGGASGDRTAIFPMDVANNGQYNDSYTLSGSVTFTDAVTGLPTAAVPVLYYAPDGTLLPRVSSVSTDPGYNQFITPVIAPGTEYKPIAVVQTPAGTKTGDYTVSQTSVGNYSTTSNTDTNDIIRVSPIGSVPVAKFAAKAGVAAGTDPYAGIPNPAGYTATGTNGAKPGDRISYRIIAKNNYNTAVTTFFLRDTVPANTELFSVALNPTAAKTIYRVNSGSWSATVPAAGLAAGTVIDTALDLNNDSIPDDLAPGATLSVDFVVTVK
ncbi:DUF11 domain-containing protein [Deinococcus sp. KSM4-11]|uniref:DUF11 domain-containing protein n=1 Tax=Deinococcus sp. KSM4-11 TaxID=2568654 RepID=UPI0010A40D8E|nr:DUF11 domain-containing protein [Deinococcus sp. KSM4-11]THF85031.1 DUF11 domain-containing protein [Deinococcus sp. KSM4-11]